MTKNKKNQRHHLDNHTQIRHVCSAEKQSRERVETSRYVSITRRRNSIAASARAKVLQKENLNKRKKRLTVICPCKIQDEKRWGKTTCEGDVMCLTKMPRTGCPVTHAHAAGGDFANVDSSSEFSLNQISLVQFRVQGVVTRGAKG